VSNSTRADHRQNRERTRQRIVDAAAELLRERPYSELNVNEVMERAGIGRTLFYRHFADLGELLLDVAQEAMDELYDTEVALDQARLAEARDAPNPDDLRQAVAAPVAVYDRHGPLLQAVLEAATVDPVVAERVKPLRERFDALIAEFLERAGEQFGNPPADPAESARALNRLNEGYLVDAFGRGARVSPEIATRTLTEIWLAFVTRR
jgi:AcrR family transcriptional regulator